MLNTAYQHGKRFNKQAQRVTGVVVRIDSVQHDRETNYHRIADVRFSINRKDDSMEFIDFNYNRSMNDTISVYYNPANYEMSLKKSSFLDYYPLILFIIFCSSVWTWIMIKY